MENKCLSYGGAVKEDIIKIDNYITKKEKKWNNIRAKIQTTVYGEQLLHIKYTLDKENNRWQHDHRIIISKIK